MPRTRLRPSASARASYEFGVKVSMATSLKEGLVVGMRSMTFPPKTVSLAECFNASKENVMTKPT
jgi:hypothetical protein